MQRSVPNTYDDPEQFSRVWDQMDQGRNIGSIETCHAAERDSGGKAEWFSGEYLWAELEDRAIPILRFNGPESEVGAGIVKDKQLTKELLAAAGVSVPAGRRVVSAEDAVDAQAEIGTSVVVKPLRGNMGHGVTVNISNSQSIREAYDRARAYGKSILVEQYVDGDEYRAHATPTECVGLFKRLLPTVTGDGYSTIDELVREKNELRKLNPSTRRSPIPIDDVAEGYLQRNGLSWDSVVPTGETIVVRDVNGITSGGESEQCLESAPKALTETAIGAVAAVPGMHWGGVDILLDRRTGAPYVIEVNSNAAFFGSVFPVYGKSRDVGASMWKALVLSSRPDVLDHADQLPVDEAPRRVQDPAHAVANSDTVFLKDLLRLYVRDSGSRIRRYGSSIWSAEREGSPLLWFRDARTVQDIQLSIHPLRRLPLLRKILRLAGLSLPPGRSVRGLDDFLTLRARYGESLQVLPLRDPAVMPASVIIPSSTPQSDPMISAVMNNHSRWFVQVYKRGFRYRVIASNEGALAVIASSSQALPSQQHVDEAVRVAVDSVRAVPQLRWAGVDVVIPSDVVKTEGLIEGMSVRPVFVTDDLVVAGSLEAVFEMIIRGASAASSDDAENR